ncbi:hypothetical protein EDD91_7608 [Streptomyces sp. KS 21]|nr:hypothetical protein EDD91_7608 [Streptomyces sp. KS 21]
MAHLDQQGVDFAGFLTAAHGQGVGVDRAVAAPWPSPAPNRPPDPRPGCPNPHAPPRRPRLRPRQPPPGVDALAASTAPLRPRTEGLTVRRDLDLGNQHCALKQLKVQPAAYAQMMAMAREALLASSP